MFGFGGEGWLLSRLLLIVPLWLSLGVHEWAHAWSAWKLGDDTAAREGRLTLDPLAHVDPLGTFALPLLGIPFGWAKPVPISPARFRAGVRMDTGVALTAAAGPLANVVLAVITALVAGLCGRFAPAWVAEGSGLRLLLDTTAIVNAALAIFNLLPIPPLDGSRIADGLVPEALRPAWNALARLGPFALLLVLIVPIAFGASALLAPLEFAREFLHALETVVAG